MKQKVLMIVTSHNMLGSTGKPTGLYLSELAHPYEVLVEAGCDITVASPKGGDAPIDPGSIASEIEKYALLAKNTKALHTIKPEDYDAYLVVGGHGTMWDLAFNADLNRILPAAFAQGKVVAAVCHGPVALTHLKNPDGAFMIRNKKVTGFTNEEEFAAGLTKVMPFLLEDELIKAGAAYLKKPNWAANVVVDGNLVTGQNPASAKGVGEAVASLLCVEEVK
ncbi:MAG: type 1 glutamine amidotransferase domain-containing protein [Hydrogenophilales bacterium]|nr:type 1 glutamine amidotransferase domain-containing protein [Hydrogenophilales bacterium]